jgi:hypothetical protein
VARLGDPKPERRAMGMGYGVLGQNAKKRSIALNLKTPEGQ